MRVIIPGDVNLLQFTFLDPARMSCLFTFGLALVSMFFATVQWMFSGMPSISRVDDCCPVY